MKSHPAFDFAPGVLPRGAALTRASAGRRVDGTATVISEANDNARFDYDPITHAARGVLIEPAATNLALNSDTLSTFTQVNITRSTDGTKAPDGTTDAQKIAATATSGTTHYYSAVGAGSASGNCFSIFVKKGSSATVGNRFALYNQTTATTLIDVSVNLDTGLPSFNTGDATKVRIVQFPNGWWLVSVFSATGISNSDILRGYAGHLGTSQAAGAYTYMSGAQLEAGPAPTSYVPTAGSTATRQADALVLNWASRGVADGAISARYTFDDWSMQDVATTVASGTAAVPTNLNRPRILRVAKV